MNDNELFELCKEVYGKLHWQIENTNWYYLLDGEVKLLNPVKVDDAQPTFHQLVMLAPLYTSDYLLEKLDGYDPGVYYTSTYQQWIATAHDNNQGKDNDTPLKALLKLVIALYNAGVKLHAS